MYERAKLTANGHLPLSPGALEAMDWQPGDTLRTDIGFGCLLVASDNYGRRRCGFCGSRKQEHLVRVRSGHICIDCIRWAIHAAQKQRLMEFGHGE